MANLTIKKDPFLLGFAALFVAGAFVLVFFGFVTWKEAAATILAALALPGLFGAKEQSDVEPPKEQP